MRIEAASNSRGRKAEARAAEPLGPALLRKARRSAKFARRLTLNALAGGRTETRVVFITGAPRSGTRVPLLALEDPPDVLTYRSGSDRYFDGVRLKRDETLDTLFGKCPFPVLVLKPLSESHRARHLLERFPGSRVLWIFRWYQDVVKSASLKWGSGPQVVEDIVNGRLAPDDWRAGGLTEESLDVVRKLYQPGLGLHHANAILWYLRSRLVLDQELFRCPNAQVIKYEDLVTEPAVHFPRVFDFIGVGLEPRYLDRIHARSVRRTTSLELPRLVADTCEALHEEIERHYQSTLRP